MERRVGRGPRAFESPPGNFLKTVHVRADPVADNEDGWATRAGSGFFLNGGRYLILVMQGFRPVKKYFGPLWKRICLPEDDLMDWSRRY